MEKLSQTLEKLRDYVEEIERSGGPKNQREIEARMIWNAYIRDKAFNNGKRKNRYNKKTKNK